MDSYSYEYVKDPECKLVIENKEYLFTKATWSGNKDEAARKLTFGFAKSEIDPYLPKFEVQMEDLVQFYAYGQEIFRGYVTDISNSLNSNETQVTCYDGAFYLLKSQATRAYRGTKPEETTRDMCQEVAVPLAKTMPGDPYDRIHDGDSVYEIIMTGYVLQSHKDGNQYMLRMDRGAVNIVLKGEQVCPDYLTTKETLTQADYAESITSSINRVKIYDEGRKLTQTVDGDKKEIKGVLQAIVQVENGKNAVEEAKALLKGIEKTASVAGLGRIDCITGNACVIEEPYTKLKGLFYIDGDTHTFDNSSHTMSLELAFKNVMAQILAGSEKDKTTNGGGFSGVPVTGPDSEIYNVLRGMGYSKEAAATVAAHAFYESNYDTGAVEKGGTGAGRGLFQWSVDDRWPKLLAWCSANGHDPYSIEGQVRFADHEMRTTGVMEGVGGYEAFKNAATVQDANRMFYNGFERPLYNAANYALREQKAADLLNTLSALEQQSSGGSSDGTWTFPVPGYSYMSSDYGANNPGRPDHLGVDFAAAGGTPTLAASGGTVTYASWADGYGNLVVIDHGGGIATAYAHIMPNGIHVSVGQGVSTGQKIASVGTTGPSTGNHLHFEVRTGYNGGAYGGRSTNPRNYITY